MDTTTVLITVAVTISAYYCYSKFVKPFQQFSKLGIPGPTPLPVVGNILNSTLRKGIHPSFLELAAKYGDVFGIFFGTVPVYYVSKPEMTKQILVKEFQKFSNKIDTQTSTVLDLNLESLRDDHWKRVRNILVPSFTASKLKNMLPLFEKSLEILADKMKKAAAENETVEVWSWYGRYTLQVVMASAFGIDADCQRNTKDPLIKHAAAIFRPSILTSITLATFPALLPLAKLVDRRYFGAIAYLEKAAKGVIKERLNNPSANGKNKDMLQLMLDAGKNDPTLKMTDEEMIAQAMTFLLAGYETTSNTLSFISYVLATHPDIQDKLIEAIEEVFDEDEEFTYEGMQKISYLENVINETLRIYPAAYFGLRECGQDCTIEGYHFSKDSVVIYPIYGLHHDARYWEDPEKFDPDRFSEERKGEIKPFTYLPFSTGPRVCIGMRLAMIEIKITLCYLLRRFKFVQAPETEVPVQLSVYATLCPANGIKIRIADRKQP